MSTTDSAEHPALDTGPNNVIYLGPDPRARAAGWLTAILLSVCLWLTVGVVALTILE